MTTQARGAPEALPGARSGMESGRVRRVVDLTDAQGALLDLVAAMPLDADPSSVAGRVLDALANILEGRALGVCLVVPGKDAPVVLLRRPPGVEPSGPDPIRLFPELGEEWVLDLAGLAGSTLHVAAVQAGALDAGTERAVVERAAAVLTGLVRGSMAIQNAKPASAELTELRAQLVQAEKLATLGQIVAGVVHELANPVTSIVACTDFLLRKTDAGEARDDLGHLTRISVAADRILKFSRDLVAYARPAREKPGPVPLNEVVAQAHGFTLHELERHGIEFHADYAAGAPPVLGQPGPLTQVFVNLFTNAAHAMSDHGGNLSVRTLVDEGTSRLRVEVTDTGVGIPAETIGKIFEPFFTTKEAGRGTGLGLSIVREIIEAHGGTVDAASTPGEGTTFAVSLPLYRTGSA